MTEPGNHTTMPTTPRPLHRSLHRLPSLTRLIALGAIALVGLPIPGATQTGEDLGQDLVIDSVEALPRIRVAVPPATFGNLAGAFRTAGEDTERTLRDDLELSGVFAVQGPTELSVLDLSGDLTGDFEQFRSLGNEVVVYVDFKQEGDRIVLEGRAYDLASGQSVLGKRYRGQVDQARRVAHTFSDDLVQMFTGEPGIALTQIVFHSKRDGFQELYLMDYDGRNQRRITGHKSTSGFADWSGTGDAVAYLTYFSVTPQLYYVDMATGQKVDIFGGGSLNLSPSFSPDGREVAFAHSTDTNVDIYTCARQCSSPQRLTRARGIDTNPSWDPDGKRIAFTSDRSGQPNIYVMNRDGSGVRRISFDGDYNDGATWHPSGTQIAYASRRRGGFRIVVTDLVSLETRILVDGAESYEEPSFSPDGRRLVFTAKRSGSSQIYVINADGTGLMQLTHDGSNAGPDWSPRP